MATLPQIPLQQPMVDPKSGRVNPQWSMWLTALVNNLPPPNSRAVIDGSGSAMQPTTILQGPDAAKPTPAQNHLYFSTDDGTIWVVNANGGWQLVGQTSPSALNIAGGSHGSIVFQAAPNATGFITPGSDGQVLSVFSGVPQWVPASSIQAGGGTNNLFLHTFWT